MGYVGRRRFLVALGALLALPVDANPKSATKVPRIGYLAPDRSAKGARFLEDFRAGLRELGHIEGQTVVIDVRWAEGNLERLAPLAADLVHRSKVDVMFIVGCGVAQKAVRAASKTLPVVVGTCGDLPGFLGEAASFARPGGNTTGQSMFAPELSAKRLALLKELIPGLKTAAVLWNPADSDAGGWVPYWHELRRAASILGIELLSFEVRDPKELGEVFRKIELSQTAAVLTLTDPLIAIHSERIVQFGLTHRLVAAYDWRFFANQGGLLSYGASLPEMFRGAAVYVDKILRGAKPADIPIGRATKFEFVVNLKTAKAIGVSIPSSILLRADHVIE